jgi:hypothetical protein
MKEIDDLVLVTIYRHGSMSQASKAEQAEESKQAIVFT